MDSIGHIFKTTRERKRISLSYAAATTRIKLQNLEMMERDDFTKMPAPAYAKGFIRMYADFLGIDSAPLVQHYVAFHQGRRSAPAPTIVPPPRAAAPAAAAVDEPAVPVEPAEPAAPAVPLKERLRALGASIFTVAHARHAGMVVAVVLLGWALVSGVSRCARRVKQEEPAVPAISFKKGIPSVIQEPPEPYIDIPATKESPP